MRNFLIILLLSFTFNIGFSQSLKQQLWEFASDCHQAIKEGYEEEFQPGGSYVKMDWTDVKLEDYCNSCIDDSGNGYLYIEGSWPTCGCSCHSAIGGYRKANGEYTLIKYEQWPCSNSFGLYSNENLMDVMPEDFSLKSFNSNATFDTINYFHLNVEVPRVGTDTKVSIQLLPLGQIGIGNQGISLNTKNSRKLYYTLYSIEMDIASNLENDAQLQLVLNNKLDQLPQEIRNEILSEIGDEREFKSGEELISQLNYIKTVYEAYTSLEYTKMTFSWNKTLGRFEIKDKSGKPKKLSLLEFIKEARYFSLAC